MHAIVEEGEILWWMHRFCWIMAQEAPITVHRLPIRGFLFYRGHCKCLHE